jgi:hypothetical protein
MLGGYISYGRRFFELHFPYGFFFKDNTSTIEDLQEENSRTLGNYSRSFKTTQGPAGVPSSLKMLQVILWTSGL